MKCNEHGEEKSLVAAGLKHKVIWFKGMLNSHIEYFISIGIVLLVLVENSQLIIWAKQPSYSFFQYQCDICLQKYTTRRRLASHRLYCVFCNLCERFVEKRHLSFCKGKKIKLASSLCNLCHRYRSKRLMSRHMKLMHGINNWKAKNNPEHISKVTKKNLSYRKWLFLLMIFHCQEQ